MVLLLLICIGFIACAILAEVEKGREEASMQQGACPSCGRDADADWLICPHCRTMLRESCECCGLQRSVFHRHCTHCGASASGRLP